MAYAAFSVVFGEQPSAAKWNILGTNDASFNDGTGIAGLYKNLLTVDSNPYKFSVYLAANQTGVADATFTKILFDTENFDTNNNFASNKYTVPVTGFYQINLYATVTLGSSNGVSMIASLYKNGSEFRRSDAGQPTAASNTATNLGATVSDIVSLTAGDYLEGFVYADVTASTSTINAGPVITRFSGFLVSRT